MSVNVFAGPNADLTAASLAILAEKAAQDLQQSSNWFGLKRLIQQGLGPSVLPVGTQIADEWKKTADAAALTSIWDVVHHDAYGSFLNWHYALPEGIQFDAPEAIYYADGSETAGAYYIQIAADYGTGWATGQCIQITTSVDMAAGDKLWINCGSVNTTNPTNSRTWKLFAADGVTQKDTGTTSNGTNGTKLGDIGTDGTSKAVGRINSMARVVYGYNRWAQSGIRQYLNSDAAVSAWWRPQNPWDIPPDQLATLPGFLAGYGDDFKEILEPVEVVTALNTVEGLTETLETTRDKIFLPALEQWNCTPQLAGEGDEWEYYTKLAEQIGVTGNFGTGASHVYLELIKYRLDSQSSPVSVWLRSAFRGGALTAWYLYSTGYFHTNYACNAARGCPACKILKSN